MIDVSSSMNLVNSAGGVSAPLIGNANEFHTSIAEDAAEQDGITDFFTQGGLVSAIVSGGVSMYNTGAELATFLGADDHDAVQTEDVIGSFMSQDSVDYYNRHKEGIDTIGFVATSLIPGMVGIKGLRAVQAGLRASQVGTRTRLATGIRAALVPAEKGAAMRAAIESGANMNAVKKVQLYKEAFHQEALEAAAYEGAVLLTMNQNPTINKEGLGYFDAIADNAAASAAFVVGGGVIGGALSATIKYAGLKKLVTTEELKANDLYKIFDSGEGSFLKGDPALLEYKRYTELKELAANAPENAKAAAAAEKQKSIVIEKLASAMGGTYKDENSLKMANTLFHLFEREDVTLDAVINATSGVQSYRSIGAIESAGNVNSQHHVLFMGDDEFVDILAKSSKGIQPVAKGKPPTYTGDALQLAEEKAANAGTSGVAFPYDKNHVISSWENSFGNHPRWNEIKGWLDSTMDQSFSSVKMAKDFHKANGGKELTMDQIIFTQMHELGHMHTNKGNQGVLKYLSQSGNKNADKLLQQMELVSRNIADRKGNWRQIDALESALKANPDDKAIADALLDATDYMRDPHELLADTWETVTRAIIDSDKELLKFLKANAPDALKLMRTGSKYHGIDNLTDKLLPGRRRLLNMDSSEIVDTGIAPTIADIGNVTSSFRGTSKTVFWGQEGTSTFGNVTGDTVFNPKTMTAQEANALYYLRLVDPAPVKYEVAIPNSDLPRLTRAVKDMTTGVTDKVKVTLGDKTKTYTDVIELRKDIALQKDALLNELRGAPVESKLGGSFTYREIARVLDVEDRVAYKGVVSSFTDEASSGYNFFHSVDRDVTAPTHVAMLFGKNAVNKQSGYLIQGLAKSQSRIQAQKEVMRGHVGAYVGEDFLNQLPESVEAGGKFNAADRYTSADSSSGMLKSGNENYLNSWATWVGKWVSRVTAKKHEEVKTAIAPHVASIVKDTEAKAHMAAMDSMLRQRFYKFMTGDAKPAGTAAEFGQQVMADISVALGAGKEAGEEAALEIANMLQNTKLTSFFGSLKNHANVIIASDEYAASIQRAAASLEQGDSALAIKYLDEIVDNKYVHEISNTKVSAFHRQYVGLNDELVRNRRNLHQFTGRSVGGLQEGRLYPGQYNTKDLPYFKFVISANEKGISNDRHIGIISGRSAEELAQIEKEVLATYGNDVKVITKTKEEVEHYKQLEARYDAQLAIDENSMNAELHRKGRAWNVAPVPTERVVENYVNNLLKGHTTLTREMTAAHFGEEVATLKNAASSYEVLERATFGGKTKELGKRANLWRDMGIGNPYSDKIRQLLNINNLPEYKTWHTLQQTTADKFNEMSAAIKHTFKMFHEKMVGPDKMNEVMQEYGLKPAFAEDTVDYLYANTKIPRQDLERGVAAVNGFIATVMLRMDGAQALTDIMSTAITTSPALKQLAKDLNNKELQNLLHVTVPNVGAKLPTPAKAMLQAQKEMFTPFGRALMKEYQEMGMLGNKGGELLDSIDAMSKLFDINGARIDPEGYKKLIANLGTHAKSALTWANDKGVDWAKFVSIRSADIVLEAAGVSANKSMRATILNSFVNDTHGNYLASQRPALFQGWGGQLLGLFQTYQFNLIQQFAKHLGEDRAAAAGMVGIQAGVFGAQSLPGFQALNNLVLEHSRGESDMYTGTNRLLGNEAAEWLLYGLGSQITTPITGNGISLYSRGNLTPRSPILIPTRIEDIPAFRFTTDVLGNIYNTVGNIANADTTGAAAQAFWEGVAHNGLNRPLQGLGQLMAGGRTTGKGSLIMAYNEVNASLVIAKALGVTELNEAVATDAFYRREQYNSAKNAKLASLGNEFKTAIRSGEATGEATTNFMRRYAEYGGNIQSFGKWMKGQMLGATQSQLTEARLALTSNDGLYMQSIMGADIPEGFNLPKAEPTMPVDINSMFQ